jgi:hypothetical protein
VNQTSSHGTFKQMEENKRFCVSVPRISFDVSAAKDKVRTSKSQQKTRPQADLFNRD